ncbi:MAG TPA: serine protease [Caulobacteraceae bacterium]|jgi:V8-like Glu-specific endopeptidase|nr:serine protease [Caulobacteraceae bacterium]
MRASRRGRIAATAAALAVSTAGPAFANVFALEGQDPRTPQPRSGPDRQYAPIGVVTTNAAVAASEDGTRQIRTRGTGFLVSPCYVLTNYHAVFGLDYDGPDPGRDYSATFSVGVDPDYAFRWQVRGTPVRWGAFNQRKEHDWALVRLEGCVGGQADIGWLELAPEPGHAMQGLPVVLAGYPADKSADSLWAQAPCKIEGLQPGTDKVLHGCSVHSGASGAPLIEVGRGAAAVVAIQCGELNAVKGPIEAYDPRYANTAVTIAEVFQDAEARSLLEADRAAFPGPNPAAATQAASAPGVPLVRVSGLP